MRFVCAFCVVALTWSCCFGEDPEKLNGFYQPKRCGPIALFAVCRWHSVETSVPELMELSGSGRHGTSVAGLVQAAKAKGFKATAYASSPKHLTQISGPAIVDYPLGHFSVLLKASGDEVIILDPPKAHAKLSMNTFEKAWGGHVIEFVLEGKR